jgi:hypothetical protein
MMIREEILDLLRTDQAFREEVRRQLLTEELLALPRTTEEMFQRQGEQIQALIEAQRRTEERVEALAEAQQRTDAAIRQQSEQIQGLTEAQRQTEKMLRETNEELRELISWQRGEAGRRSGEQYEQEMIRQAFILFNGGQGGSPGEFAIRQQLGQWLKPLVGQAVMDLKADQNPFLADLIWWKGERIAVVEVSTQVNGYDVDRAVSRAETLQQAGVQAFPVVIGRGWANDESRYQAGMQDVEWKVGSDLSDGFVTFRRADAT